MPVDSDFISYYNEKRSYFSQVIFRGYCSLVISREVYY